MPLTPRYIDFDHGGSNLGTLADPWQNWASISFAPGEIYYFKKAASRVALGTVNFQTSGTAGNPIVWQGCTDLSDPDAGGFFEFSGEIRSHNGTGYVDTDFLTVRNFDGLNTASTTPLLFLYGQVIACNCKAVNTNVGANFCPILLRGSGAQYLNCYIDNSVSTRSGSDGSAVSLAPYYACARNCIIFGSNVSCIEASIGYEAQSVTDCVLVGNGSSVGIKVSNSDPRGVPLIGGNIIYNCTNGIELTDPINIGADGTLLIDRNIIANCTNGINNTNVTGYAAASLTNNAMYGISGSRTVGFANVPEVNPIALSADPFVDAANGNFAINKVAGGGAVLRAATRSMTLA